jgi:hypothetical protein
MWIRRFVATTTLARLISRSISSESGEASSITEVASNSSVSRWYEIRAISCFGMLADVQAANDTGSEAESGRCAVLICRGVFCRAARVGAACWRGTNSISAQVSSAICAGVRPTALAGAQAAATVRSWAKLPVSGQASLWQASGVRPGVATGWYKVQHRLHYRIYIDIYISHIYRYMSHTYIYRYMYRALLCMSDASYSVGDYPTCPTRR